MVHHLFFTHTMQVVCFCQLYNLTPSPNQYICYLQILYLNALDTGDVVDQSAEVIVSVWTRSLVTQITGMDRGI